MPRGRPTLYNEEVAAALCERMSKGEPLARICDDPKMPCYTTVWNWEQAHPEFLKLSTRARELGTHYLADDCLKIADGAGDPADKRIRIDTRLRLIGKWNRKGYGDKVQHVGGDEGDSPIAVKLIERRIVDPRNPDT
jgi:hypothetical protein